MRSISNLFASLQKILIEPPSHIQDVEIRHKSRLLNSFLLPMILVFLGVDGVYLATLPGYTPPWYGYVFLVGSYILNRSRFYSIAAFITLVMFPVVIFANIVSGDAANPVSTIYYLVPGVVLAGILLSLWATAFFALIEIAVVVSMTFVVPNEFPTIATVVGPVSVMSISTVLVLVSMWFRNQIEKDRQEMIRRAEEKYRNIFENAIDGIFQSTPDGRFLSVNPAMARMYGYDSPEEMIQSITDISSQLYVESELRNVLRRRLAEGEKVTGFELHEYRKDGSMLWTSMNVQAILDASGNTLYYEGTVEDITNRQLADEALRESEERYRTLFNRILDGIYRSSHEGRFLDVNPAMLRIFGYDSREEMLAIDIKKEMYFAPGERESLFLDTGQEKVNEFRMRRKDGSEIWVEDHGHYIHDKNGNVIYHEGILRDITQRKQAELEREQLIGELALKNAETETLRESLASIVGTFEFSEIIEHILDQIGRVVPFDSASIWKLEGNVQKLIANRNLPSEIPIEGMEIIVNEKNSAFPILTGEVPYILNHNVQAELLDFKNPPHNIINSWLAIPLKTRGKIIGLIALDGHGYKQFNEHHAQLAVTFANQVAIALENASLFSELQNELFEREKLIKELESKNAELERFTYTVSHDLKSPIITIRGFLGLILEDIKLSNSERLNNDIKRISEATDRMQRLLNELLDLSRVGRLINPPQTVQFANLVKEALANLRGELEARKVKVVVQQNLPAVNVDRVRLVEVLQNLVGNACNFMGDKPKPKIEIGQYGQENGNLIFGVKDNGIGIAAEYHERVFGLFNKLDATSEGTGIGLALVKSIIEFHGGRIWVESEAGNGAAFYFTLPPANG